MTTNQVRETFATNPVYALILLLAIRIADLILEDAFWRFCLFLDKVSLWRYMPYLDPVNTYISCANERCSYYLLLMLMEMRQVTSKLEPNEYQRWPQ